MEVREAHSRATREGGKSIAVLFLERRRERRKHTARVEAHRRHCRVTDLEALERAAVTQWRRGSAVNGIG